MNHLTIPPIKSGQRATCVGESSSFTHHLWMLSGCKGKAEQPGSTEVTSLLHPPLSIFDTPQPYTSLTATAPHQTGHQGSLPLPPEPRYKVGRLGQLWRLQIIGDADKAHCSPPSCQHANHAQPLPGLGSVETSSL